MTTISIREDSSTVYHIQVQDINGFIIDLSSSDQILTIGGNTINYRVPDISDGVISQPLPNIDPHFPVSVSTSSWYIATFYYGKISIRIPGEGEVKTLQSLSATSSLF